MSIDLSATELLILTFVVFIIVLFSPEHNNRKRVRKLQKVIENDLIKVAIRKKIIVYYSENEWILDFVNSSSEDVYVQISISLVQDGKIIYTSEPLEKGSTLITDIYGIVKLKGKKRVNVTIDAYSDQALQHHISTASATCKLIIKE